MSQNPKHPMVREVKLVGAEAELYQRAQGALVSLHLELPWPPKQLSPGTPLAMGDIC